MSKFDASIINSNNNNSNFLNSSNNIPNYIKDTDEMIIQAITCYCKAYFGFDNTDAERYIKSYESLKAFLKNV